jgi:hypothetical protein
VPLLWNTNEPYLMSVYPIANSPSAYIHGQVGETHGRVTASVWASPGTGYTDVYVQSWGAPIPYESCVRRFENPYGNWPGIGGLGMVTILTETGCAWTITSSDPSWLVANTASGVGSGIVYYTVRPNGSPWERYADLIVSGQPNPISQDGTPGGTGGTGGTSEPTSGDDTLKLDQAPTVVAGIGTDGTLIFEPSAAAVPVYDSNGALRFAVPKSGFFPAPGSSFPDGGSRFGFLDVATAIHWIAWPKEDFILDDCFGNCGAGCTAKMIGGLLPSPCESPDYWSLELLSAHTAPNLVAEQTIGECFGSEESLNEYDVYMGTVRWTYHGVWTQSCEDHDWVMRQNALDGSPGLLPFSPSLCSGSQQRNWNYEALVFGLKFRASTSLPQGSLSCPQSPW